MRMSNTSSSITCVPGSAEFRLAALLSSGKADGSATPIHTISGNSPARKAVNFQWEEVLLSEGPCNASDAVYELASVLISLAVWKQKQAVRVTDAGKSGSTSEAAIKVHIVSHCKCARHSMHTVTYSAQAWMCIITMT